MASVAGLGSPAEGNHGETTVNHLLAHCSKKEMRTYIPTEYLYKPLIILNYLLKHWKLQKWSTE